MAASSADLTSSPFEGSDGNMIVDQGGTDWASFSAPVLKTLIDTPTGTTDNSFTQGTHEDDPNVTIATGSIPPNKNDLQRAYLVSEPVGSETFLYLAWERLINTGSANIDFELNQVATPNWDASTIGALTVVRTEGDILITYDFGGSGNPDLGLLTWLTPNNGHTNSDCEASGGKLPCWGNRVDLGPTGVPSAVGAVNTGPIAETVTGGTLDAGLFGEAKIDLSLIPGLTSSDPCKSFGNMFVKSRSSGSSIDAELKDFIAPAPIHVSNCATLKVVKHSVGGTGTFAFAGTGSPTPTPVPASQVAFSGFNIDTSTGQNGTASQQFAGFKPGSQYTVAESGPPSGWQFTSVACTDDNTGNPVGSGSGPQGVAFTPTTDQAITCTFTNTKQATLTVNKVLVPSNDTGKFNLQIDQSTAGTGANVGNNGTTGAVVVSAGSHTVRETAGTGTTLSNYTSVISGDCASDGSVTIAAGDNKVCTITNTRKPTLTVNKVVVPSSDTGKFNLQINGQTAGTGANVGNGGTTGAVVETAGSYTVGEAAGTATSLSNYTSAITGDCAADGSITLAAGQNAVCTITNTKKGTIAVKKVTVPSPNATDSFSFTGDVAASLMDGQTSTPVTVTPGTYSSVEGAAPGFDLTSISCNDANSATPSSGVVGTRTATFKVDPGENVVCTFTNTRQTGTIVLKKHWVGTPGTTTLSIDQGQTNITSKSVSSDASTDKKTVPTGNYTVSEAGGLANYASSLACFNDNGAGGGTADNGTKDGSEPTVAPSNATSTSGTVAVGNGDHIVCTLTNTRAQGTVELKKAWVGTAGNVTLKIGTAPLGQEIVHTALTGTAGTTGPQPVNTGTYFVSETIDSPTDGANYSSILACFNDANNNGSQDNEEQAVTPNEQGGFDVASGDHVICTFTNRELPQVKLVKSLDPSTDDGTFDFAIDQQSFDNGGDGYGDTGTTGFVHIQPGAPVISETGHGDTDLSAYDSSISCTNEDSTDGTSLDMSALTYGDKVTCTFTNHRLPTITIGKRLLPASDTGTFDFTVDPGEGQLVLNNDGAGFGNNDSVEVIVSTGTHTVTESGHGNTLGADYSSSWSCSNEQSGTGTSIDLKEVGYGDNIVCTFTNTKLATLIVVKNVDNSNGGGSKGPGDFSIHVSTGGLDLPGSPAAGSSTGTTYSGLLPGTYKVGEDAVSGYNLTGISGCLADGSVVLQAGATVTCTLTNTSNAPPPPPPPPPPAPKIDLQITKSASPNPATLGGNVTWTMVVTNNGPNGATGVTVADPLPAGTTFVSVASSQGTCTNGAVVSCQLGSMAVGTSVTITLVTGTTTVGTITNTATTVGNEAETNTANNTATATDVVNGAFVPPVKPVVYCTALAVSPKSLFVGRKNTLTMKVSQHGKAVKGIKVKIKGSSLKVTTKGSNANGVVKQSVRPMKAGIVTFSPVAHSSCKNPRIGVIGVFTPPVTG